MVKKIHSKRSSTRLSILGRPSNSHHPPFLGVSRKSTIMLELKVIVGVEAILQAAKK